MSKLVRCEGTHFNNPCVRVASSPMIVLYVLQRRIEENKARMGSLGLVEAVQDTLKSVQPAKKRRQNRPSSTKTKHDKGEPVRRRSKRVAGESAPELHEAVGQERPVEEVEEYGIEHVKALGHCTSPWELFVDGYDAQGNRVYDKAAGMTCHQCRQKTLGKRTSCSSCESLQGVFCGDCLYMRYGENIDELPKDGWACPPCRDLCNCSFHRSRRGWCPTGSLYRKAQAEGYPSVAHYLVLQNLKDCEETRACAREMWGCLVECSDPSTTEMQKSLMPP